MYILSLVPAGTSRFWIGLTDLFHEGKWVWASSGTAATYTNWDITQPDNANGTEHFAHISEKEIFRKWNDYDNDRLFHGLCQFQL
jgi:hypothetical protein